MTTSKKPLPKQYKLILRKPSHNPLDCVNISEAPIRKAYLAKLIENISFYDNGSYLLSGQRGSGKTTMLNQLICLLESLPEEAAKTFIVNNLSLNSEILSGINSVFTIKIDIVKSYDEIQLLEMMLRHITSKLLKLFQMPDFYRRLKLSLGDKVTETLLQYIKDCQLDLDYHKTSSIVSTDDKSTAIGVQLSGKFEAELNVLFAKDGIGIELTPEVSREITKAIQKSVSLDARQPSIERLEYRLTRLLSFLKKPDLIKEIFTDYLPLQLDVEKLLTTNPNFGKGIDLQLIKDRISNAWQKALLGLISEHRTENTEPIFDRILIVIDDTDKADYSEAIRVLGGLRTLFQHSAAFFIFTGSESFYEEWYSYNTPGARSSIDSIFHNVYYLPPLSLDDAKTLLTNMILKVESSKSSQNSVIEWCSKVILFISQGFPRQIMRSLDMIAHKRADGTLEIDNTFFDFFFQSNYPELIVNFVKVYSNYHDPRYEKCLYIASMVVSGVKHIDLDSVGTLLQENNITASYPPVVRNRIIEDLKLIWLVKTDQSGDDSYDLIFENCLALQQSPDQSLRSVGSYFLSLLDKGILSVTSEGIITVYNMMQTTSVNVNNFIPLLLNNKVIKKRVYPKILFESGERVVIIGPREITGIQNGTLDPKGLFYEQAHNQLSWYSRPASFRRFLIEN